MFILICMDRTLKQLLLSVSWHNTLVREASQSQIGGAVVYCELWLRAVMSLWFTKPQLNLLFI